MTIKVGDKLPSAKLRHLTAEGPKEITTDELFSGKKAVLFAVPGAFTPTCSAKHVPGFVQHYEDFVKHGVEVIACIAVNDAFVMGAWGKVQQAEGKVVMLADGNAEFTKAIGLGFDGSGFGLGYRSQRYAMLLDDGVVTLLNVEKPGSFEVSKAETILEALCAFCQHGLRPIWTQRGPRRPPAGRARRRARFRYGRHAPCPRSTRPDAVSGPPGASARDRCS